MRESAATVSDRPSLPIPRDGAYGGEELAAVVGGRLLRGSDRPIRGASVDSRRTTRDSCFFALPGERTDGHPFLRDAVLAGASAVVVTHVPDDQELELLTRLALGGVSVVAVHDGVRALQALGRDWRSRFSPLVVGITGSIAKTTTKEAIAETLSVRWRVLRNEGNENNEIGLPMTLLRLTPEHEVAVLEMGMYVPGEIAQLAAMARPSIGVVTAVRGSHMSRAGSMDAIERGKGELVEALPQEGTAVLNADDVRVLRMARRTDARVLTYGFTEEAQIGADEVESLGEDGMRFLLRLPGERRRVSTPALGRHSVHNALAAAAVGHAAGMAAADIVGGLERGFQAPHRTTLLRVGEWRILDDSYNAAPDSMAAALELLRTLPGRRIAVLGEMLELGEAADEAHRQLGRLAGAVCDLLVTVGDGTSQVAEGAREVGLDRPRLIDVRDREHALEALLARLRPGDVVLVKASRGAALEWIVERLSTVKGVAAA